MIRKYFDYIGENIDQIESIVRLEEHQNISDWYIDLYDMHGISSCVVDNAHQKLKDCEKFEDVNIIVGYNQNDEPVGRALIWRNVKGVTNSLGIFVDRIYVKGHGNPSYRKRTIQEQRLVSKLTKDFERLVDDLGYARRIDSSYWDSRSPLKGTVNSKIEYTFNKNPKQLYLPYLETFHFGNIIDEGGNLVLVVDNYNEQNSDLVINECGYDVMRHMIKNNLI